jgi:hypothetical protein
MYLSRFTDALVTVVNKGDQRWLRSNFVEPVILFDQRQEFAGMQNFLAGLIHSFFKSHFKAVDAESKFITSSPLFLAT